MKKSRKALLTSALSLLLCFSMLLGTTYAWFTDSVESTNNIIQAGNLDVELEYWDKDAKKWESVGGGTPLFEENTLWEPGYTQVVYLRAANKGTLALKYQLGINIAEEKSGTRVDENGQEVSFKLSDSIYMGVKEGVNGETGAYATREAAVDAVKDVEGKSGIISKGFNKYGDMNANDLEYLAVVVYMPESVGNEANHKTGTEAPKIKLGIKLYATQKTNEEDSFGSDYDAAAKHPYGDVNYTAAKEIPDDKIDTDSNNVRTLNEAVTVGNESDGIYAEVPDGVQLADGATALELTVQAMDESNANITTNKGETAASLDVHVEGVHKDNQKPIVINLGKILPTGLNDGNAKLYHVEYDDTLQQSVTKEMTRVANPVNHNEFSYDPATGEVVVAMAKFSEVTVVTNDNNDWDGTADDYSWYVGQASPYKISSANQLAAFGRIVDGTASYKDANENTVAIPADSFLNKIVQLDADITLSGGNSFNPIGCGYADSSINSNGVEGRPFRGTFDGGIYNDNGDLIGQHTISGLYQNGWKLGLSYCNLGGGLFASIADGTVQNLTISGAYIVMECVEMGVLVGLSQGNCNYTNINIYGCKIANYQRATGGLIGEVSPINSTKENPETTKITNVKIDSNTVVGSLWGDFDCPVGGVIGARWDDGDTTKVEMKDVAVAARLDVYNDVTSTYQWYAYRRAGMLIGNTDTPPADGKNSKVATADFLTCLPDEEGNDSVVVIYGDWVNYHYCQFSNYKPSWPWVRVEAGENCSAYSNPRYGVPNDINGNPVTADHDENDHLTGDGHNVELKFGQLYGGGQGVYGQTEHAGVVEGKYTVTYVNDSEVLDVKYVTEADLNADGTFSTANDTAKDLVVEWAEGKITGGEIAFGGWMNAGSTKLDVISADNKENIVLYPSFTSPHTASFVDQKGNILAWCFFNDQDVSQIEATRDLATKNLPDLGDEFALEYWKVRGEGITATKYEEFDFTKCEKDVTLYPYYTYTGAELIPIDSNSDGDIEYYQVAGYTNGEGSKLVEIPGEVNGVKVTTINPNSFSSYDDLTAIRIPANVTSIGAEAFADEEYPSGTPSWAESEVIRERETVTFYYEGSPDDWNKITKAAAWDNSLGEGSRVFFLNANGDVDLSKGYWELDKQTSGLFGATVNFVWQYHNHAFPYAGSGCSYEHNQNNTDYDASTRPDQKYWVDDNGNSIYNIQG